MKAAAAATREIALAVSATTLSLLVIFLPIVFMGGLIGRFFSAALAPRWRSPSS